MIFDIEISGGGLCHGNYGVMQLEAKDCWQPPGARRGREPILSWDLQREGKPADTLISDFGPSGL